MQQPKTHKPKHHEYSQFSSSMNVPPAPPYYECQMAQKNPPLSDPFPPNHNFTTTTPDHSQSPNPPNSTVYGFPYSHDHPTTLGSFAPPHIHLNSCVINIMVGDQRLVSRHVRESSPIQSWTVNGRGRSDNDQISQQHGLDASRDTGYASPEDEAFAWPASSKRIVLKLDIDDNKTKQKVLKSVSGLTGIHSIDVNMEEKKLTVIGHVDAIELVRKLRKICHAELLIHEPANEPEKKDETYKIDQEGKRVAADQEEPKREVGEGKRVAADQEEPKRAVGEKDKPKIKERDEQIAELIKAYKTCPSTAAHSYYVHAAEENPNSCVIC